MVEYEIGGAPFEWVPLMGTRVLKVHTEAVKDALPAAKIALQIANSIEAFASVIAEAVVTAADSKTAYAIVGIAERRPFVFGPYVTYAAAMRALKKEPLPIEIEGITVVPIHPHPRPKE